MPKIDLRGMYGTKWCFSSRERDAGSLAWWVAQMMDHGVDEIEAKQEFEDNRFLEQVCPLTLTCLMSHVFQRFWLCAVQTI